MTTANDYTQALRTTEATATRLGGTLVRYGLVVVIGWIGLLKFASYEAYGIEPFITGLFATRGSRPTRRTASSPSSRTAP